MSAPSFPPPLSAYSGEEGLGLAGVLAHRIAAEPLSLVATLLFFGAILHTFFAPKILALAHRLEHRAARDRDGDGRVERHERPLDRRSFVAEILHFFGEIEAVFGLWVVPLLATIALARGWGAAEAFVGHGVVYTEPLFVVVIMAIASTRPVLDAAEALIGGAARLAGGGLTARWLAVLSIAPLLGSFVTEPAAMVVGALLLSRWLYALDPSPALRYATIGLLFVNVSVGGTLTHFAAPPVLMVAGRWGWDSAFMARSFGWKAMVGILVANALYALLFRRELAALSERAAKASRARPAGVAEKGRAPLWIVAVHLLFLAWTVFVAHTPALFVGGFLFFLAFLQATAPHQGALSLRSPLLVGFFLAGLVVHGALQQWWIEPVLSRLAPFPLFVGAGILTAFNDNAAITYLATLVPSFGDAARYAVVAGAVAGGGLTVIANAPNPAGLAILSRHFPEGFSALRLAAAALPATLLVSAALWLL